MKKLLKPFLILITLGIIVFSLIPHHLETTLIGEVNENEILNKFHPIPMPIEADPKYASIKCLEPKPQRTSEFRQYLAPSLRLSSGTSGGSATIISYDSSTNTAWAISCGHFWNGGKSVDEIGDKEVILTAFYHNETKLDKPRNYKAKVHFYYNQYTKDISLISFKPDWIPKYYTIAPLGYNIKVNQRYHSTGCDGFSEVAHYDVKLIDKQEFYITKENSPRPGRSGGGLFSEDHYIAICVRTSDTKGNGIGMFITLDMIHKVFKEEGFDFLLNDNIARQIEIKDVNNPQGEYDPDYIPLPVR